MYDAHIYTNGTQIERVKQYTHLGTMIKEQWYKAQKIKCIIGKAFQQNERTL